MLQTTVKLYCVVVELKCNNLNVQDAFFIHLHGRSKLWTGLLYSDDFTQHTIAHPSNLLNAK